MGSLDRTSWYSESRSIWGALGQLLLSRWCVRPVAVACFAPQKGQAMVVPRCVRDLRCCYSILNNN